MADKKKAKQVVNFIQEYLEKSGDMDELRSIVDEFDALLEEEEKINTAVITTAFKVDTQQKERVEEILRDTFGSDLEFEYIVNPSVLGGMKVKVYDQVIDLTVDSTLTSISQNLKQ